MEKTWMAKNRLTQEYEDGVEAFLKFALENGCDANLVPCPCTMCANTSKRTTSVVRAHLICNGIDMTYKKWIWHGEGRASSQSTHHSTWSNETETNCNMEKPVDMIHDAYAAYEDNPSQFQTLIEDAQKPLYPGCSKFTKLSATVKLYNLKAKYSWSDNSFSDVLSLLKEMLPEFSEFSSSFYEAKKTLSTLGLEYEKIHACRNDCVLYRKEYKDNNECPTCGLSRWKVDKNDKSLVGIPSKVLWYFPPVPRFRRMFRTKEISKELTWHADRRTRDGVLRHPADAPAWKLVDNKWPDFGKEPRNLRLGLAADGFNPYNSMSSNYSCWPVVLVMYNLPPWLCMKRKFMMLTLLIPGPKQPGNDIDVYLAPLIDDLKQLWEVGFELYDSFRDESFLLKSVLLWTINDFPAYGNLSGSTVKGYKACPVCADETYAKWLPHSRKMSFTGHRRYSPAFHPYRRHKKAFDGFPETGTALKPLSGHEVLMKMKDCTCVFGKKIKGGCSKKRRKQAKEKESTMPSMENSCFKKRSIFFDLDYWKHLYIRHILDVMHIEKNVFESLINTLLGIPGKTKDGIKARMDLVEMRVREELAPKVDGKRTYLPPACFTLSKAEKIKVLTSLQRMKLPEGYSSNVSALVSMKDLRLIGLKSHDCHVLMQQLLPIALRGVLPKHVRIAVTRLCLFFNAICDKQIDVPKLEEIQKELVTTLCLLEKKIPPSFFDIMVHLTVHLVREVKLCGPVWYRWMYPFERFMKILKGYVRNRHRPEGCIAECYVAEEAVEYCSEYLSNIFTVGIPSTNLRANQTRPLTEASVREISDEEWEQAHRYVLTNDIDIDEYIKDHKIELAASYPKKAKSPKWIHDQHNKLFTSWIRELVANQSHSLPERLKWLFYGPSKRVLQYSSYLVDGVVFHTRKRDDLRAVQNSGVSILANTMQVASAKDKNPIVSDMLFYGIIEDIWELDYTAYRVVVFKCTWADNKNGVKIDDEGVTIVNLNKIGYKDDSFILGNQARPVFYLVDPKDEAWSVVLHTPNRKFSERNKRDELGDISIQLQSFSKGIPSADTNNPTDEDEPPCVREDCEPIWVNNADLLE